MNQATYDAAVAARKPAEWPTVDEAKAYLLAKGFVAGKGEGAPWTLPSFDHVVTDKQAACLEALKVKAVAPPKEHALAAESGAMGAGR